MHYILNDIQDFGQCPLFLSIAKIGILLGFFLARAQIISKLFYSAIDIFLAFYSPFSNLSEVPQVLLLVYVRASELRAIFRGSPALENYVAQKKNFD